LTSGKSSTVDVDVDVTPAVTPRSAWLRCIAVVCFDVDAGQVTEFCMPSNSLTLEEKKRIAYLSLPDSYNSDQDRDGSNVDFTFRTRRDTNIPLVPDYENNDPPHSYDYGYVYFRRSRDPSVRRGYVQKAVSVSEVSLFPLFFSLFYFTRYYKI
jgi:hypothetical protein